MNFTAVQFLHSTKLVFKSLVLDDNVLILMKQVVDFELQFWDGDLLSAKLVFELDEFVFEFDPHFSLIVKIVLVLLLGLFELFPLVFEHKFDLSKILIVISIIFLNKNVLLLE